MPTAVPASWHGPSAPKGYDRASASARSRGTTTAAYAVSGMGAVCHTINPRLFPEQIAYIINHAEDSFVFFDISFTELIEDLGASLPAGQGLAGDDRPRP